MEGSWVISSDGDTAAVTWGPGLAEDDLPKRNDRVSSILKARQAAAPTCSMLVSNLYYGSNALRASTTTQCSPNVSKSTTTIVQRRNAVAIWVDYGAWQATSMNLNTTAAPSERVTLGEEINPAG